ncbi:MAG: hypothetical protein KGN33_06300, partial [Paracoccaceae bacterium]|nr:hypothetical protein [Paracoccaceae bacterium]
MRHVRSCVFARKARGTGRAPCVRKENTLADKTEECSFQPEPTGAPPVSEPTPSQPFPLTDRPAAFILTQTL